MNRAYSVLEIKAVDEQKRTFTGIASTPSTDRMGDVVEPKGAQFKLPIPLLWQHNSADPIGWVTSAKVTDKGIEVEGEVASVDEDGTLKDRLTQAWQMMKAKLVRGLSIGFASIESARIDGTYGIRFMKWEWLELSAVTIPANQDASITAIKSIDDALLAASGHQQRAVTDNTPPGVSGKPNARKGFSLIPKGNQDMKTITEQIAALVAARAEKSARMQAIMQKSMDEGRSTDAAEAEEFDTLEGEIKTADQDLARLRTLEKLAAEKAVAVKGASQEEGTASRGGATILVRKSDADEKFKGQNYVRMVIAKAMARLEDTTPASIAMARWAKSNPTLVAIIKANEVPGGGSGSGEWGHELVTANNQYTGDFIEYLYSQTVFDKLPLRSVPANVLIKGQDGAATGYWVGESKPIPATTVDFMDVTLTPLKVAALAVISNELIRDSSPDAEMLVRDALVNASAQRVDTTFLSTAAAVSGVSPAGILNGVTAIHSAGPDGDGLRADIKALYAAFITAKNATGLELVTNPALAKSIQLMTNTLGLTEFPGINATGGTLLGDTVVTGDNVNPNWMMLLKPSDIYRIGDLGVQVSVSREAMIEQSSAPTGATDTPVAASQMMTSMFQSESTAIKVVRPISFGKRRASAVQYIDDADYGAVGS
jgi:HK97 family phage prohead protease